MSGHSYVQAIKSIDRKNKPSKEAPESSLKMEILKKMPKRANGVTWGENVKTQGVPNFRPAWMKSQKTQVERNPNAICNFV